MRTLLSAECLILHFTWDLFKNRQMSGVKDHCVKMNHIPHSAHKLRIHLKRLNFLLN